ncbi:MAG: hypothetical protein ABL973_09665 [Micropepsaceae bacterium]
MLIWVTGLPPAVVPLWHEVHVPITFEWSTCTVVQFVVMWQLSQLLELVMCRALLPVAVVPLWQLEQVPVTAL